MSNHINRDMINTLIAGHFADPFSILGMHKTTTGLEVHALLPNTTNVWVIEPKTRHKLTKLECLNSQGFFSSIIPRHKNFFHYQLAVVWHGQQNLIDDPYHFGPLIQEMDAWLLSEGTHLRPYETLGTHADTMDGITGTRFSVWAPNTHQVSVVGQFNYWDSHHHPMHLHKESSIWELFIPGAHNSQLYKYKMIDANGNLHLKSNPYAFKAQMHPETTSLICRLPEKVVQTEEHKKANQFDAPISIYEVHLGSWHRHTNNNFWLSYHELANQLVPYAKWMGFTHLKLLPINKHPFNGSWGYQPTSLYAPTHHFGTHDNFHYFIDATHTAGLNMILNWVPGHFPTNDFALAKFDGTNLYEHSNPREGYHQDWNTLIYNYGHHEVSNFLISNTLYWIEHFGIDALHINTVASMIYHNYSHKEGEWIPNKFGRRENLEAIEFLHNTNHILGEQVSSAVTMAEESTNFPGISHPQDMGSLGFWYKWNLSWMHDTLDYMKLNPVYHQYHHNKLTFRILYNYTENFILPLSHDEVVHSKKSILNHMPGNTWQKFTNLHAYYGWMWAFPGKKLLFMGNKFAQGHKWNHDTSLNWHLLEGSNNWHHSVQHLVHDLNLTYHHHKAMHELDFDPYSFEWLVVDDKEHSVLIFVHHNKEGNKIIIASNFTPVPRHDYHFSINQPGKWHEILNTNSMHYHSSNAGNGSTVHSNEIASHSHQHSLSLTLPPLATIWLVQEAE